MKSNDANTKTSVKQSKEFQMLSEENLRLKKSVDELAMLNDLSLAISGSLNSEQIMQDIINRSIRAISAEQGDITLVGTDRDKPAHTLVRSMVSSARHSPLHLNMNLLGWIQINKKALIINEPNNDIRFRNVEWDASITSVLSAPLMAKSKLIGILTLYNKTAESDFTESDQRLLSIIAAQSAQVVENARLYEEEQKFQRVRQEMELASNIQKRLLPSVAPNITGYELAGRNKTAKSVGGDYYDFIPMDEHRCAICLGDISGKGLPASLLMANLQAVLRSQILHLNQPGDILTYANAQLFHSTNTESFATLFFGILNTDSNTLQYSSAGHDPPFLMSADSRHIRLKTGGIPLGVLDEQEYREDTVELDPGACLVIYTDGVTESMNRKEEEFGEKRLLELLVNGCKNDLDPQSIIDAIFKASIEHRGQPELFDDMTSVVLVRDQ